MERDKINNPCTFWALPFKSYFCVEYGNFLNTFIKKTLAFATFLTLAYGMYITLRTLCAFHFIRK